MNKVSKYLHLFFWTSLLFFSITITANTENINDLTHIKFETWLKGYEKAWETLDANKAALLFTKDATYQDDPYKPPYQGRGDIYKYWAAVTADQKDVDFTFEILSVVGNTGIAHWHSEFLQPSSGSLVVLDGIFVLDFSENGLCQTLKEWWHYKAIPAKTD